LVALEELQAKLYSVHMYIDVGGKAGQFQARIVDLLAKLGLNEEGFIITVYLTRRTVGEVQWKSS
jgi:hypothetical protein